MENFDFDYEQEKHYKPENFDPDQIGVERDLVEEEKDYEKES